MLFALALDAFDPATPGPDDGAAAPIINGTPAGDDVYPMTGGVVADVSMEFGGQAYELRMFTCSSTLIAPDVVALAAHCLDSDALTMGMGEASFNEVRWSRQADLTTWAGYETTDTWPEGASVAWDWVVHPDFDIYALEVGIGENADIALLFLDAPVLDVEYARLPLAESDQALLVEGAAVDVVGWGQQTATSGWEMPPEGTYAIKTWGTSVVGEIGEFELQVGPAAEDTRKCHGDSGGPTFQAVGDGFRLVGVTSHAYDQTDCNSTGGVDTRVDAYLDWIDAEMRARCEDGTRAWCEEEGIPAGVTEEPPADTGSPAVVDEEEVPGGCACSASPGALPASGAIATLGLLAALLRRRGRDDGEG